MTISAQKLQELESQLSGMEALKPVFGEPIDTVETVSVLEDSELSAEEESDRLSLERQVERAFYQAGKALKELRDRRLYRSTHKTFPEYLKDRFGMKQSRSYQLIDAVKVVDNLSAKVPPLVEVSDSTEKVPPLVEVLPTSDRQVRPLAQLEPSQQREVWQQAVEKAGGKVPSSRIVKDIVQHVRERTQVLIPYSVGDVCSILVKDNPELRGKGGCWGIVTAVGEFSCTVRLWDGEYQLQPEYLKELPYSPAQKEEARILSDRLSRLYHPDLEETARAILASLGQIERPFLTPLEEEVLAVLETRLRN